MRQPRFKVGDRVIDRDGFKGTIRRVVLHGPNGLWYEVALGRTGEAVRYDSDLARSMPITVTDYSMKRGDGSHIRYATRVAFPSGREVKFIDRLPSKLAIPQAQHELYKQYREHWTEACPDQEPMAFEHWINTLEREA